MNTYTLSLDIWSTTKSRSQMAKEMGKKSNCSLKDVAQEYEELGKTRGDFAPGALVWRFASELPNYSSLEEHLAFLAKYLPLRPILIDARGPDCLVCLEIEVFYDAVVASRALPANYVKVFSALVDEIYMNFYPDSKASPEKVKARIRRQKKKKGK